MPIRYACLIQKAASHMLLMSLDPSRIFFVELNLLHITQAILNLLFYLLCLVLRVQFC